VLSFFLWVILPTIGFAVFYIGLFALFGWALHEDEKKRNKGDR